MLTFLRWGCFRIPLVIWFIVVAALIAAAPPSWWLIVVVSGCIMVPWLFGIFLVIRWAEEEQGTKKK